MLKFDVKFMCQNKTIHRNDIMLVNWFIIYPWRIIVNVSARATFIHIFHSN